MLTPWNIIFGYKFGPKTNAQAVYDEIFRAALTHKFRGLKSFVVPVNSKILTESIFNLNSHDKVNINNKVLSGQKLKELFITTIFLKRLETQFAKDDYFFIVIPQKDNSCDTAIMVAKSNAILIPMDSRQLKLPPEHIPFLFQVKEYFNFERMKDENLLTPKKLDANEVERVAGQYSESTLIFIRDLMNYYSDEFKKFFEQHPNCYCISATNHLEVDGQNIQIDPNKHNYVISFPKETYSIESFNRPHFLLNWNQI